MQKAPPPAAAAPAGGLRLLPLVSGQARPGDGPTPPGARTSPADASTAADPRRLAEGWERRFVADPARAAEMIELYRSLGYETAADPARAEDLGGECDSCRLGLTTIYTRPASHTAGPETKEGSR